MNTRIVTAVVIACIVMMFAVVTLVVLATGTEQRAPIMDTSYLGIVKKSVKGVSDKELIDMGHFVCTDFELYDERYQISDSLIMSHHITPSEATVVIDTAISNYCPQFKGR